ncbi:Protein PLASTID TRANSCRIPTIONALLY ACTIVE 7 [Glycine soja]
MVFKFQIARTRTLLAMAIRINSFTLSSALPKMELRGGNSRLWVSSQMMPQMRKEARGRRVWRRRKLIKKDEYMHPKMERIPFMEEQVRIVREQGKLLTMDIERLMLSEDNRFDFVNEIAAEANSYVENNRDEYGGEKKAILHVLSNRMNDTGIYRPEAYYEPDPFKPGPHYLREEFT